MPGTDRCMKCSSCVRACPVVAEVGEMAFPGPRTIAVDAPRFGPSSVAIAEVAWLCSMCERCARGLPIPHTASQSDVGHEGVPLSERQGPPWP